MQDISLLPPNMFMLSTPAVERGQKRFGWEIQRICEQVSGIRTSKGNMPLKAALGVDTVGSGRRKPIPWALFAVGWGI
jgi:hypothetical protein